MPSPERWRLTPDRRRRRCRLPPLPPLATLSAVTKTGLTIADGALVNGQQTTLVSGTTFAPIQFANKTILEVEASGSGSVIINNPHPAKLKIPLPDDGDMLDYMRYLQATAFPQLPQKCEVPLDVLARRLTGLSRIGARTGLLSPRKESCREIPRRSGPSR